MASSRHALPRDAASRLAVILVHALYWSTCTLVVTVRYLLAAAVMISGVAVLSLLVAAMVGPHLLR